MLRQGWAAEYKEAGAVYGAEGQEEYVRLEKEAQCVSPSLSSCASRWISRVLAGTQGGGCGSTAYKSSHLSTRGGIGRRRRERTRAWVWRRRMRYRWLRKAVRTGLRGRGVGWLGYSVGKTRLGGRGGFMDTRICTTYIVFCGTRAYNDMDGLVAFNLTLTREDEGSRLAV